MNKFRILLAVLCITILLGLNGCTNDENTIRVFNWGEFIDEEVLVIFTERTGITVIYDMYDSNESMFARLQAGGEGSFDVVFPSDYMIERMIGLGMLYELNLDNIPNFQYIDERFKDLPYDPGNRYSVPYMWGTVGILYNTTMVGDTVIDSWDVLWDPQFAGNIFMYNSMRDSFAVAFKRLGYSLNSTDPDELRRARDLLIEQRPLVRAFGTDDIRHAMIGGEAALAVIYSGCAMYSISYNPDLHYVVPREGSNIWFDAMVIPRGARNRAGAEAFINFMSDPYIAFRNTMAVGYSTTNWAAFEMLPEEKRNNPIYWPPDEVYYRSEVFVHLGEFTTQMEQAWMEVLGH